MSRSLLEFRPYCVQKPCRKFKCALWKLSDERVQARGIQANGRGHTSVPAFLMQGTTQNMKVKEGPDGGACILSSQGRGKLELQQLLILRVSNGPGYNDSPG
jgi:hypothetical protein